MLRSLIREMCLKENIVVTLTSRDVASTTSKDSTVTGVLSPSNAAFIQGIIQRKNMTTRYTPLPDWLATRIERIKVRVGPAGAELARAIIATHGYSQNDAIGTLIVGYGKDAEAPKVPMTLDIPNFLMSLALIKRPGAQQENTGKGEALAILLFGRDAEPSEPDLVIGSSGFSVKYFGSASSTVKTGKFQPVAGTYDKARATYSLLKLATNKRKGGNFAPTSTKASTGGGSQLTRNNAKKLADYIRSLTPDTNGRILGRPQLDIQKDLSDMVELWNNTSFSDHPMISLSSGKELKLQVQDKSDVRLGVLRWSGKGGRTFSYEIASPVFAAFTV